MIAQMDGIKRSEQQEIDQINAFLGQFTLAEQVQLMTWVDELTTTGNVMVHESHSLHQAFDRLVQFINHQKGPDMPKNIEAKEVEDVDDTPLTPEEIDQAVADLRAEGYDIREGIDPNGQIYFVLHGLNC
jgi:hypothetical protein